MIKEVIQNLILKCIKDLKLRTEINIEYPPETFGHYSTNIALVLAKEKNQEPYKLAQELLQKIKNNSPSNFFSNVEIKGPGFINFSICSKVFEKEIEKILKNKTKYGVASISNEPKIQIEYISANPTGPLTVANGRGGFLGDILANILEFNGAKVEREYYVNDTGNQIITLGKSILARAGLINEEENFYKGNYIKEWVDTRFQDLKIEKLKDSLLTENINNQLLKLGQLAAKDFLKSIKTVIKRSRINFDRYTSEYKDIHQKGYVDKVLKIFTSKKLVYKKDGALWLKTTQFGDDKDRVLITSDGYPTYFLIDAGHYLETKKRGFKRKIIILGPDHYGYVKRIQAVAEILGIKDSKVIVTQAVRLISKGQRAKISKRKGEFLTLEELLNEVGEDATRFFFLMYSPETHMNFDLDLAKERSAKNPVYYLQYAAVRCKSILEKSKNLKSKSRINLSLLNTEADINLMKMLIRFPEIVAEINLNLNSQILVRYALDLSKIFHNFYEKERILNQEKELAINRLALIKATYIIFRNLFRLLGLNLPQKM